MDMIDCSFEALKASGAVPHWFGLGFIQLKLNHKQRMHFWHPEYQKFTPEEEVHNHRYSFCSRIIAGEMIHETWNYVPDEGAGSGTAECIEVSCKPGQPANPIPISTGTMTMSGRYTMPAGSKYFFPATGFHRTITKRAVTLLCRGEIESENALVIRPIGTPTICPFSIQKSESECWEIIRELLS